MTLSASTTVRSSRDKRLDPHQTSILEHLGLLGLEDLLKRGKAQGYVLEDDVDALFDERAEPPDDSQVGLVRQALLDRGVAVVGDETELPPPVEDLQLA